MDTSTKGYKKGPVKRLIAALILVTVFLAACAIWGAQVAFGWAIAIVIIGLFCFGHIMKPASGETRAY